VRPARALIVLLPLGALIQAPPAGAQSVTASITGTVRGDDGSPLPGAIVEARAEATGMVRATPTDRGGRYRIGLLAPGVWSITARIGDGPAGDRHRVTLGLQETATVDLSVSASVAESVTVREERPLLGRDRPGGELSIDRAQVDDLPISGRQITDLALLDSSVKVSPPGDFYGERGSVFVLNGQSGRANSFLVDGLDNNDQVSNTTLDAYFSGLVIREFKVLTQQFAPEFGRAGGGVLNIITAQGTNTRERRLFAQGVAAGANEAGSFPASLPNPSGQSDTSGRFETGFSFGGPMRQDRSFYFLAYEHQQAEEVLPFTGVGRDGLPGGLFRAPRRDDNLFFRTDFTLGEGQTLMLRLSSDDRSSGGLNVGGTTTPENGFHLQERDRQIAASLGSVLGPGLLNEARLLVGVSGFDEFADSSRPGVDRPSGSFGGNNLNRQIRDEGRAQIVDNLTWQAGPHTLKFGVDLLRSRTRIDTRFNPNGNFLYNTDLPFEPGDCGDLNASDVDPNNPWKPIPCPGQVGVDDDGDGVIDEPGIIGTYPVVFQLIEGEPRATLNDTRLGLFAQDTWQSGDHLSLNYGLRYDLSTFRLPAGAGVPSTIPNGGARPDRDDVAPRLGFTYAPGDSGTWLIRGGGGRFYDKLVLGFPAVAAITSGTAIGLLFPQGLALEITENTVEQVGIDAIKQGLVFPPQLILRFSTGTHLPTPYTDLWNLGLERAIGGRGTIQVAVTRSLGVHQSLMRDLNPVVGEDAQGIPIHRDPNVGSIAAIVSEGRSWYSGLDLQWRWRGEQGWWSASYTLSKALDLGPDPLKGGVALPPDSDHLSAEKGRSDADRRHRVVIAGSTRLPWAGLRTSGILQVASGAPFNVTTGSDDNKDGFTNDRPPGVGRNTGAGTSLGAINSLRAAFGLPLVDRLREPSFVQLDLRVSRPFPFRSEAGKGEVFLQVFNLFNRFNGGPIEGRALARDFGDPIGQAGPPRTLEGGLQLSF
jgi:outer membrane receptor protein involved in Fe transport